MIGQKQTRLGFWSGIGRGEAVRLIKSPKVVSARDVKNVCPRDGKAGRSVSSQVSPGLGMDEFDYGNLADRSLVWPSFNC